jgi:YbgC/YbaW family acyl-CoA thioester hydrolase
MMVSISVEIDDTWITPVYEHVHHGRCFSLFEEARCELLRVIGFPNEQLLAEGKVLVITKVSAEYKREVKRGVVQVTCDRVEVRDRSLVIHQRILNQLGKVAVEAVVESMFMNTATRRGMVPPPDFLEAFLRYSAAS